MSLNKIYELSIYILPLFISVVLHEIAHGFVALKLGDPTAKKQNRLTLNPLPHIDLYMTILFPLLLVLSHSPFIIGGAKPVPVNPMYFKHPRKGMGIVALAGPLLNLILALLSFLLLKIIIFTNEIYDFFLLEKISNFLMPYLEISIFINIILMLFNLIPILPLDGGRILNALLPSKLAYKYSKLEKYGFILLLLFVFSGGFSIIINPVINFLTYYLK